MELRPFNTFAVAPALPPGLRPLGTLAYDLWWTWSPAARALFERLDPTLWRQSGNNPVALLQMLSPEALVRLAADPGLVATVAAVDAERSAYLARPERTIPAVTARQPIAYFSLEYALTESFPNYAGGLGVLAGDHLKSVSDLGLPFVAVGLLYRQGYFSQTFGPDGWQREEYRQIDTARLPVQPLLLDGAPLRIGVPFPGREVRAAVWRVSAGRVPLYLLDPAIDENAPADQALAQRLYGGDLEARIQQEMLLGIGGMRLLAALGIAPSVVHMNEGHSGLLGLERVAQLMARTGLTFDEALLPATASAVFTTHTAVAAGIDLFPADLVTRYLREWYSGLGLGDGDFLGLGRVDPGNGHEPFSMALLGLRLSAWRNGVSEVHAGVSRKLWEGAWPGNPSELAPIGAVTNGVHLPTWVGPQVGELFDRHLGSAWRDQPAVPATWEGLVTIPDDELWAAHVEQRNALIQTARERHQAACVAHGLSADPVLDSDALTVGFARRFAGYKRATLLFRDLDRLADLLNAPGRPVQIIFAGKAHPRDDGAKQLIREVIEHSRDPRFAGRLIVLEGYDLGLARLLVQGCDVWLNTPLRPLEASGTSGMKAVANGGLHLSVPDGWWAEAYRPGRDWAVGGEVHAGEPDFQDALDAGSLYSLMEDEVIPRFYERDERGLPWRWVAAMKDSIAAHAARFNTHRMLEDYCRRAYEPAAAAGGDLMGESGEGARALAAWLNRVRSTWATIKICAVSDDAGVGGEAGMAVNVDAAVFLDGLAPQDVCCEAVFGAVDADGVLAPEGAAVLAAGDPGPDGVVQFRGAFRPRAGRVGYAIRLAPAHPLLADPASTGLVLWALREAP